jgi:hypothetical protein
MIAITTSNSIKVNAARGEVRALDMRVGARLAHGAVASQAVCAACALALLD